MEQLSEIPRALEMSAQLYMSTPSLPVTSLTTQLDTEQMSPWTLPLLNLSLHFTSTTMPWPVMLGMQTRKPHVCNEETSLQRPWKNNQLIQLMRANRGWRGPLHVITVSNPIFKDRKNWTLPSLPHPSPHTWLSAHTQESVQGSEGSRTPCTWYSLRRSV